MIPLQLRNTWFPQKQIDQREQQIRAILAEGKIVVFTQGNLVKKVREWKTSDKSNDLIAFESNGLTHHVCWQAKEYIITAEDP